MSHCLLLHYCCGKQLTKGQLRDLPRRSLTRAGDGFSDTYVIKVLTTGQKQNAIVRNHSDALGKGQLQRGAQHVPPDGESAQPVYCTEGSETDELNRK